MRVIHRVVYCLNSDSIPGIFPNAKYYTTNHGARIAMDVMITIHLGLSKEIAALKGIAMCKQTGKLLIKIESVNVNSGVYSL